MKRPFRYILFSILFFSIAVLAQITHSDGPLKKYPPYPNVWGYDAEARGIGHLCAARNGDFYMVSSKYYQELPKTKVFSLFGGSEIEVLPKDVDAALRDGKPLSDVGDVECFGSYNPVKQVRYDYPQSLTLRDGSTVKHACLVSGACGIPYSQFLEIRDKNGQILARKAFLYLLERPRKEFLSYPKQVDDVEGEVVERVYRYSDASLIPLKDDTFFVGVGAALIRFDKEFKTKFPTTKHRIFVVDPSLIDEILRKEEGKSPIGSLAWHQGVRDAVFDLVMKINKEKLP